MSQPVLRLMRFLPQQNRIDVLTLEVPTQQLVDATRYVPDTAQHQFTLPLQARP